MPKKSQAGQEVFDMARSGVIDAYGGSNPFRQMSNKKAILFIVIAGAFLYYFLVHRRK